MSMSSNMQTVISSLLLAALFGLLLAGIYQLITWLAGGEVIERSLKGLVRRTEEKEQARYRSRQEVLLREGRQQKTSLYQRYDNLLRQSGMKSRAPWLNTGLLSVFMVLAAVSMAFVLYSAFYNLTLALLSLAVVPILAFVGLQVAADRNYKRTEEEIIPFLDLVGNFSATDDSLIRIFDRTAPYLNDPLRRALSDCCLEARITGDTHMALEHLTNSVGHEQFEMIVQNLEICTRYTNNMEEVVKDCRIVLTEYEAAKKERHSMVKNGRMELAMIVGMSGFVVYMISGLNEGTGIAQLMLGTLPGQLITVFCAGVICAGIKVLSSVDKGRG